MLQSTSQRVNTSDVKKEALLSESSTFSPLLHRKLEQDTVSLKALKVHLIRRLLKLQVKLIVTLFLYTQHLCSLFSHCDKIFESPNYVLLNCSYVRLSVLLEVNTWILMGNVAIMAEVQNLSSKEIWTLFKRRHTLYFQRSQQGRDFQLPLVMKQKAL